jgi:hypothetical protein
MERTREDTGSGSKNVDISSVIITLEMYAVTFIKGTPIIIGVPMVSPNGR